MLVLIERCDGKCGRIQAVDCAKGETTYRAEARLLQQYALARWVTKNSGEVFCPECAANRKEDI